MTDGQSDILAHIYGWADRRDKYLVTGDWSKSSMALVAMI